MMMSPLTVEGKPLDVSARLAELIGFVAAAARDGLPAHELERGVWSQLLQLGTILQGYYFALAGDGDGGETLTLTVGDAYFSPANSRFGGGLAPGTPIYAQVDSVDYATTYGEVLENHEITGGAYNNISGPVPSSAKVSRTPLGANSRGVGDSSALPPRPGDVLRQSWH